MKLRQSIDRGVAVEYAEDSNPREKGKKRRIANQATIWLKRDAGAVHDMSTQPLSSLSGRLLSYDDCRYDNNHGACMECCEYEFSIVSATLHNSSDQVCSRRTRLLCAISILLDCDSSMDLRASLGFGFFNKSKSKSRKHSERHLAEMYNKVAIRGSIQHVWGDELPRDEHSKCRPQSRHRNNHDREDESRSAPATILNTGIQTELRQYVTAPAIHEEITAANVPPAVIAPTLEDAVEMDLAPPLQPQGSVSAPPVFLEHRPMTRQHSSNFEGDLTLEQMLATTYATLPQSISSSVRNSIHESSNLPHSVHKKFSFCPSTISLVSPLGATNSPRMPRAASTSGSISYASSVRSGTFSSSTPSIPFRVSSLTSQSQREYKSDDLVSMADDQDDDEAGFDSISPSNSLHYSIISRISSIQDTKEEHTFLPGQIYAPSLPEALRGYSANTANFDDQYQEDDEDDDDSGSISGLSEVNAGGCSDSDFSDSDQGQDSAVSPPEQLSTGINAGLRRDSVKRVSYTRLDSGDYHAIVQRRSRAHLRDLSNSTTTGSIGRLGACEPLSASAALLSVPTDSSGFNSQIGQGGLGRARSTASVWSIDHEYIAGGI